MKYDYQILLLTISLVKVSLMFLLNKNLFRNFLNSHLNALPLGKNVIKK